jgi:hypothetical protein
MQNTRKSLNTYSPSYPMLEEEMHRRLVQRGAVTCCLTCIEFQPDESCKLAGSRPPAEVIVYGCSKWDDIPF